VGMMINGVEIKNYKSQDKIYSGPLSSITVVNSGTGYDVINPPVIEVANTGSGTTALVRPVISGSVDKILVDPQTRELDKVISVSITGGGPGNGVALQPVVEERFISASFDARLLTFGGGIGESAETITFLGDHNFANGEEVVYRTNGNPALGIGTFAESNADQNRFLVENTKYIAEFVNSKTIRLYNSTNDFQTGINTIGFTTTSNSGIHRFRTFNGKKTLKDVKVLEGGSNYQNRVLNVKPVGISTIDHLVNFKNHGFQEGDLIEYQNNYNSPFFYYGLNLNHKHLPEIKFHCGLENNPIFLPSVANFYQGMIVNLFLAIKDFEKEISFFEIESLFSDYYQNQQFIKVKSNDDIELPDGFYKPNLIVNSNDVEINIFKNANSGQLIISSNFDNLGKGASAAAIQCMNLRFGFDEILGL